MNKRELVNTAIEKTIEKDKLENIFRKKYNKLSVGLLLNPSYSEHKWHIYLNSIGCIRLSDNYKDTFDYLISDPSSWAHYIQIPNETALKILVLGDLP